MEIDTIITKLKNFCNKYGNSYFHSGLIEDLEKVKDNLWKMQNPTYPKHKKAELQEILGKENFEQLEKEVMQLMDKMDGLGCKLIDIANAIDYIMGIHYF